MRNAYYQLINYINMAQEEDVYYYAAKTMLENLHEIPHYSITQVADMCFASTATISRLIRRLNFPNFNDFKQDVIYSLDDINSDVPVHFENEPTQDMLSVTPTQLKNDFYKSVSANLEYTQNHVQASDIEEIIDYIDAAKRVIFIGFNYCQMVSNQLQQTLALHHKEVTAKTSEKLQLSLLQETTSEDLIILTTITGNYFKYKKEATELIKKSPAKKVVITQAMELVPEHEVDKVLLIGDKNISYIGKFSVMMIFELIEMFYIARHTNQE